MKSNIRELEGALNRIVAYADLRGMPMNLQMVDVALADLLPQQTELNPETVLKEVANAFSVEVEQLTGSGRTRQISLPRQIAMYLLRESNISLPQIGHILGGRDHTTVMYACDKISDLLERDDRMRRQVVNIRHQIYSQGNPI